MICETVPHVLEVEVLRGAAASADAVPDLLVEVPHGADRRAHYDALRARLVGDLPDELEIFFHVNTDVGAHQLGRRVAELVLARDPTRAALVLRSLIPRTFIDCNRLASLGETGDLRASGMTAGLAPYIRHPEDIALLVDLHGRYVAAAERAYEEVCGGGGLAFNPHTYGPRTLDVSHVDDDIVSELRRAHEPAVYDASPVRPEIDLITRTADGTLYAPEGAAEALIDALGGAGFGVVEGDTYVLHPATQGYRFATAWPGRVLCLEVRRDLLVQEWLPFSEQVVDPHKVERVAAPLARVLTGLGLRGR